MNARLLAPLALAALCAAPAHALDIRTYPSAELRTYEVDRAHGLRSALLQNLAVVNDGDANAVVERIDFTLTSNGTTLQTQSVGATELARAAGVGRKLWDAGMLAALDFQFRPGVLFGDGVSPAAGTDLPPRGALLLTYRPFVYKGAADALDVAVHARDADGKPVSARRTVRVVDRVATGYRFPLKGAWYIGAAASFHTAHRWNVAEEFALDVIRLGADGRTYRGTGSALRDYHAYGEPVYAAKNGRVVAVVADADESTDTLRRAGEAKEAYMQRVIAHQSTLLAGGARAIAGNHVIIEHGNDEYSIYAHLAPGKAPVRVGQDVRAGDAIGKLGHSGNSTEPHLHFQVCDRADPLVCAGLPVAFDDLDLPGADFDRALQSGDVVIAR